MLPYCLFSVFFSSVVLAFPSGIDWLALRRTIGSVEQQPDRVEAVFATHVPGGSTEPQEDQEHTDLTVAELILPDGLHHIPSAIRATQTEAEPLDFRLCLRVSQLIWHADQYNRQHGNSTLLHGIKPLLVALAAYSQQKSEETRSVSTQAVAAYRLGAEQLEIDIPNF